MTYLPVETLLTPSQTLAAQFTEFIWGGTLTREDLATGRGLTYEWEFFVDQLFRLIGDAGGDPGAQRYEYVQAGTAAVWTINHGLGGFPTVVLIEDGGQQLLAELQYPDDQTVVVIHGQPYSGTAYLRI
jgi:hypothetical protein